MMRGTPPLRTGAVVDVAPAGSSLKRVRRIAWLEAGGAGHPSACDVAMLVLAELLPGRRVSMDTVPEVTSGFSGQVR